MRDIKNSSLFGFDSFVYLQLDLDAPDRKYCEDNPTWPTAENHCKNDHENYNLIK
jgi:hypothetical protein